MGTLINKKSILDCQTNEESVLHEQEMQFFQDYLFNRETPIVLKCIMENYEGSHLAEETILSTTNKLLSVVEIDFDYKSGVDFLKNDNGNLVLNVYGSTKNIDGNPCLKKTTIEVFEENISDNEEKLGKKIQQLHHQYFQKEVELKRNLEKKQKFKRKTNEERKQEVSEAFEQLQKGVIAMLESNQFKKILDSISKFHNYSFSNSVMIALQKPSASYVAGYNDWKNKFNRQVNKGEKGIKIICGMPKIIEREVEKRDPITHQKILDSNGHPIFETQEEKFINYKIGYVYDISQTSQIEGKEVIELSPAHQLEGNVANYADMLKAIKEVAPVPVTFEKIDGEVNGYYSDAEKKIAIKKNLSESQTIKTCIHELAHSILHSEENINKSNDELLKNRMDQEVQAESVAYIVSKHFGLDTSQYTFGYVAGWSGNEGEISKNFSIIQQASNEIISKMESSLEKIAQEKKQYLDCEKYDYEDRSVVFADQETALYLQTSDEGYDYTLFKNGHEIDGGILNNLEINIDEAVNEVIKIQEISLPISSIYSFNLFDELIENTIEKDDFSVINACVLTAKIDDFMKNYDPYEYQDQEQYTGSNYDNIFENVWHNRTEDIEKFLDFVIENDISDSKEEAEKIKKEIESYSKKIKENEKEISNTRQKGLSL